MIYLDNAATTAVAPEVADSMMTVLRENYGNPSSIHATGRAAAKLLRESRQTIAKILSVRPDEILFTAGASESNNLALVGYALKHRAEGNHILTTAIEHPSVLHTVEYLRDRHGFDVTFLPPLPDGSYTAEQFSSVLRPDTLMVSVMHANNETGQLLPVAKIGEMLRQHQAVFHVDATQTVGKIPVSPRELHADFLSASAHKFHGPKGVGILYHRTGVTFDEQIHGGDQEEKHRAGTENLASIVGMAKALELSADSFDSQLTKAQQLHDNFLSALTDLQIDFYKNKFGKSLPQVINIGFPGKNHDILLTKLDLAGFAISTGSACTAGTVEPSHVLEAVYGKDSPKLKENIRISLSDDTTQEELSELATTLKGIL